MSTSTNIVEYDILKNGKVVGHFRKNIMCKFPLYSELLKYLPLQDHEIMPYGYDEEEELWENDIENLDTFLKRMILFDKKIREYYKNTVNIMNPNIKKTEIILRENNTIYGEFDYIDLLQLKLDIINGKVKEKLYYRNEHNGKNEIDKYGCSYYCDFPQVSKLLSEIVQTQMKKRIANRDEDD